MDKRQINRGLLGKGLHDPLIEGLQYDGKPLLFTLLLVTQIVSYQTLDQLSYEGIVSFRIFVALLLSFYLHQETRNIVFQVALLHEKDFLNQFIEGGYSE